MHTTTAILHKIFTRQFYIQNIGFFFLIFYLLFGVVDSSNLASYHLGLVRGFLGSYGFFGLVLLLWALYALKCTGFVLKVLQQQGYEFLYSTMGSMNRERRIREWIGIQVSIYLPLLVYAAFATIVACWFREYFKGIIIIVFNLLMCVWPLTLYERKLSQPDVLFFTGSLRRWINRHFTRPPLLFFISELTINYPRRLFSTKLFSVGVLWITFFLMMQGDYFDLRGLQIGVMLCVLLHMQLMVHHRAFDDTYLSFMDNLPVPLLRIYIRQITIYLLLFLPEIIMITANAYAKTTVYGLLTVFATALSLLILFRCILYFPKVSPEKHIRYALLTSFIVLFLVLDSKQWLAVALMQALAALIFFRKYRTYEPYVDPDL
ncbi:MAG TPA: hypothetical protein VM802_13965 [Chitinophaga sp.]|uniref:hypothetical protein n=1 Tax=Chitinophaga sp. TaxID=1869181 RepID=UPI002CB30526|nr:hypothetical protein [Chitinophaga sp.]HVI45977.1 hypothetical protein [Chitinophaga sp.]